ncbi:MAG TPA: LON peptidase substrate-binding domain-containing protein [Clostridia bacterium]|nr:LON peptidase substrate-binding domain-containing protein [Clostridia bacterium]
MELPLFPLHAVLCPGIVMPLHIFEDRYRALTRHCIETGSPFGIVLIRDGREVGTARSLAVAGVGAVAEIREASRYADGRYDLLVAGTGRFALENVDVSSAPYLVGTVTGLDDEVGDEALAERLSAAAVRRFVKYLELLRTRDGEDGDILDIRVEVDARREPSRPEDPADALVVEVEDADEEAGPDLEPRLLIPDDPTTLSYLLSGIIQVELPRRQALLEAETTVERLAELTTLLDREILLLGQRMRVFTPDARLGQARLD